MKTYRELARKAERKRRTFHYRRIQKARLWELIDGSYDNFAGEQAELLRGYCLYFARHLHPGNEVARALNIIRGDVWHYNLNTTDKDIAETLRDNGIPVRWDAKKGRFK